MNRWAKWGMLDRVFEQKQRLQIVRIKLEAAALDSTSIKVHPDATGALKKTIPDPSGSCVADEPPESIWLPRSRNADALHGPITTGPLSGQLTLSANAANAQTWRIDLLGSRGQPAQMELGHLIVGQKIEPVAFPCREIDQVCVSQNLFLYELQQRNKALGMRRVWLEQTITG